MDKTRRDKELQNVLTSHKVIQCKSKGFCNCFEPVKGVKVSFVYACEWLSVLSSQTLDGQV